MTENDRPYMIISTDSHVGPHEKTQLRKFCPPQHLGAFDAFCAETEELQEQARTNPPAYSEAYRLAKKRMATAPGITDPVERLAVMDEQGIAAEMMFAGAGNGQRMPFVGFGLNAGIRASGEDMVAVGARIWNDALAEFCSPDPGRLLGVMQIPIWDVPVAVAEIKRARANGLHVLNLPAPRVDYPPYTRTEYEPLWEVCEDLGVTLATHSGGGERPLGGDEPMGYALIAMETHWLSRRNVWQMVFGGVFERHPGLKLVLSEQRANWVTETLADMDSAFAKELEHHILGGRGAAGGAFYERAPLTRMPSEYWASNCFVGGSFLAPFEAARFNDLGMQNTLWGSDYPHTEGTWPVTSYALRNTFAHIPEPVVRRILGETAVDVLHLDRERMRAIADRIGPRPSEIARPLGPDDVIPENKSMAFREQGTWL